MPHMYIYTIIYYNLYIYIYQYNAIYLPTFLLFLQVLSGFKSPPVPQTAGSAPRDFRVKNTLRMTDWGSQKKLKNL